MTAGTPTLCPTCDRPALWVVPYSGRPPWALHTDLTAPMRCTNREATP